MHKVIKIISKKNYCLLVQFDNGEKRIYNAAPLLVKPVFSMLKDISVFRQAYIEYGAVTWKDQNGNEIDICPDKMYMDSIASADDLANSDTISHHDINWDE